LSISSLADMTVFAQDQQVWSRRCLDTLAKEAGIPLNIVTEPLPEVCVSLARAGMGVAVVASDNVAPDAHDVLPLINARRKSMEETVKANWITENQSENLHVFLSNF
jgi:hypothetical protein